MLNQRKIVPLAFILILTGLLAGCGDVKTETPGDGKDSKNAASLEELKQETVETVCSVKDARIITQNNVDDFHDLALELSYYKGVQEEQIHKVAYELKITADTWEQNLNQDLGIENAQALTEMCEAVEGYTNGAQS